LAFLLHLAFPSHPLLFLQVYFQVIPSIITKPASISIPKRSVPLDLCQLERMMASMRFIMNAGRTSKQGQQVNVGKDSEEYNAIVNTLTLNPDDLKELGVASGGMVKLKSEFGGEATFRCQEGKVPKGMIFVPYGPPTCKLMGSDTDGTGMPTSKNWEVEVEPI
jgi:formylmethanofuran dehydrogenase subunit D